METLSLGRGGGFAGRWFDGRHPAGHQVRFALAGGELRVEDEGGAIARHRLADVQVAEPLQRAPRMFSLPDGTLLQAEESDALAAALGEVGVAPSRVVRLQSAWPASLLMLVLLVGAAWWLYVDGMPMLADKAARSLSPELEARMGMQALAALDRSLLQPSKVEPARRAEIEKRFAAFQAANGASAARRIEFRGVGDGDGINAFALPGGVIVLLDGMVEFTKSDDDMLVAVLAHESGHQERHHMTRSLFRALGGVALAGLIWGDYSSVASNAAVLFGQLAYSRDDEREADDFAIAGLLKAGISPAALGRLFYRVQAKAGDAGVPSWVSTHPDSGERAERAYAAAEAGKPPPPR